MRRCGYTNFHQNRRGSGTAVSDLTWNDPYMTQSGSKLLSTPFLLLLRQWEWKWEELWATMWNASWAGPEEFVSLRGVLVHSSKWFGISSVQFPNHQLVWKVRSVQFWVWGPSASVQFSSVQPRISQSRLQQFGRSRGTVLGPLQQKSQPTGPGFVAWVEGWRSWLAVLVISSGMWCGVRVTQI